MRCVAESRRTRRFLHGCVAAGRIPTTHNRAELRREGPQGFNLVQVPGVPVGALARVILKWGLEDRILFVRRMANTVVVLVGNRFLSPIRGTKAFTHYLILHL